MALNKRIEEARRLSERLILELEADFLQALERALYARNCILAHENFSVFEKFITRA
jgi:hypothetical protein